MYRKNQQPHTILMLIILSISLLFFAVACGSGDEAAEPETEVETVVSTEQPTDAPAATEEPVESAEPTEVIVPTEPAEPVKSADDYLQSGFTYGDQSQFEDAITEYDQAIALDENLADAYLYRADAHQQLFEFEEAIADYENYLALEPDSPKREEIEELIDLITDRMVSAGEETAVSTDQSSADLLIATDEANALYIGTLAFDSDYRNDEEGYDCRDFLDDSGEEIWYRSVQNCVYDPNPALNLDDMVFGHVLESIHDGERELLFYGFQPEDGYVAYDMYTVQDDRLYFASIAHRNPLLGADNAPQQDDIDDFLYAVLMINMGEGGKTAVSTAPSSMTTYNNHQMGLALEYPADWALIDIMNDDKSIVSIGSDERFANMSETAVFAEPGAVIQIRIDDLSKYSATTIADLQEEMLGNDFPPLTPFNDGAAISIPGGLGSNIEGMEGGYTAEVGDGQVLRFGVTTLVQSGRAILIVSVWGAEYEEQILPIIEDIFYSVDLQLTAPELFMNVIFASAQQEDYSILDTFCNSTAGNDGDTQAICDIAASDTAMQAEFVEYFANGRVTGRTHYSEDGTHAQVPFLFGPDGDREETMEFILIDESWYLYGF